MHAALPVAVVLVLVLVVVLVVAAVSLPPPHPSITPTPATAIMPMACRRLISLLLFSGDNIFSCQIAPQLTPHAPRDGSTATASV